MTMREPFAKLSGTLGYIEVAGCWLVPTTHTIWPSAFVSKINATHEARVKKAVREAVAKQDARIAELERVLKDTCELMDKCAGRLNVFVAQHAGSRDEYFVFELNRLSVCAGALDAMSRKATSIKSVLGKGKP